MQVWFVSTQQAWGGGEVYLDNLATGLRERGDDVRFAAPLGSQLAEKVKAAGFEVFLFSGRGRDPRTVWRLRQRLRQSDQAVVHCNDSHALTLGGLASLGLGSIKTIGMRHTMFPIRSPGKYHRLAHRVVCVSHAVAGECIANGLNPELLEVIHVGIPRPQVDAAAVAHLRQSVCSAGEQLVVAVGNLLECKGHDALLDAFDLLDSDSGPLVLAIAGEGRERDRLEQKIAQLRRPHAVRLLGFQHNPHEWMAAADLVVHPSFQEGLCLTVVAAMMLRRPVVASAVGGLCEVISAEQQGDVDSPLVTVCQPGSASQIASAIRDALQLGEPQSQRLDAAYQHAVGLFSVQQMVQRTRDMYQSVLCNRTASSAPCEATPIKPANAADALNAS